MKALEENLGKVVYVLGYLADTMELGRGTLKVFKDAKEAKANFLLDSAANLRDISLIHGTLTKAFAIPEVIDSCIDIFLVVPYISMEHDSFFIKCADLEQLQKIVSIITSTDGETFPVDEDTNGFEDIFDISLFIESEPKDIDDLYILYGYEVELQYTFDDMLLDDALIDESIGIYKELEHAKDT